MEAGSARQATSTKIMSEAIPESAAGPALHGPRSIAVVRIHEEEPADWAVVVADVGVRGRERVRGDGRHPVEDVVHAQPDPGLPQPAQHSGLCRLEADRPVELLV